jgi:hypothetical protein
MKARKDSRINEQWHRANPMPPNAKINQRVEWHLAHQKNCACRPVPAKLAELMKSKGLKPQ